MALFNDRTDAGRRLARELGAYLHRTDVLVLGLPRGGIPVAFQVAETLGAPLDVFVVRKLGLPGHDELAMGAIASGGVQILNHDLIRAGAVSRAEIAAIVAAETRELHRRERRYRGDRPFPKVAGTTVILVDDGLATGSSMRAAVAALRLRHPAAIVVAVPVGARETCDVFRRLADDVVCTATPEPFYAVGQWYQDFSQTTDEEVHDLLLQAQAAEHAGAPRGTR